jgi:hypothetical protein
MTTVLQKIGATLRKVFKALAADPTHQRMGAYERYLSSSTDVHDLEARERAWNSKRH